MVRSRPASPAGDRRQSAPEAALDALLSGASGNPLRRALWLDEMNLRLRPHFPPPLAAHARLANVDGTTLVLLVDSPVWHARLRLASNDLLDAARSIGLDVTRVAIKTTRQPAAPASRPPAASRPMSARSRAALHDALASLRPPDIAGPDDGS